MPNKHMLQRLLSPRLMSSFPYCLLLLILNVSVTVSTFTKVKLSWVEDANDSLIAAYKPNIAVNHGVKPLQFSMRPPMGLTYFRELPTATILRYLVCQFTFERHVVSSVLNTYIPSFLVVCLSFVSFWLDVNAVPGRVTLGVTAILTLTTQIVHARNSLPHVEYLTAVDFWLFGCLTLVFLSLIEFTVTQSIARNSETPKNTGWTDHFVRVGKREIPKRRLKPTNLQNIRLNAYQNNILDLISRVVFPIILVVFTVLYWAIFAQYV